MDGIFDVNGNLLSTYDGITPEMFGAVGDGVVDDTVAIQAALTEGATNNRTVQFGYGKTYAVSSTLNITKRHNIYGNGSVIKAISAMASVIKIHTESLHVISSIGRGLLENITVDCNCVADTGIHVEFATGFNLRGIDVLRFVHIGIHVQSGFETFCDSIRCSTGHSEITAVGTIGLYLQTNDSHFSNIVTINVERAVVVSGNMNFFSFIHCWNTKAEIVPQTVMFDLSCGNFHAVNCYSDTCAIAVKVNDSCHVYISGLAFLATTSSMPAEVMGDVKPKLFHLASSASTSRIKGYGINLQRNIECLFSNLEASDWTNFDWRKNNDTTITYFQKCPQ